MSSDDNASNEVARRIAKANGIPMPDERLPLFAVSFIRNIEMMRTLLAVDLGDTEPAGRFQAPPSA
jgi:hypothetical protein